MTLDDCYNQHKGTAVSFDGIPADAGQCLQWVSVVNRDVYDKPAFYTPYAKNWWLLFKGSPLEPYYDQITDGSVKRGDIVVYNTGVGNAGHIDVASQDGTRQDYVGYDSNWGKVYDANGYPVLHTVHHNDSYNQYIYGSLRLKGGTMDTLNQGDITNIWNDFNGHPPTQADFDAWTGKTFKEITEKKLRPDAVALRAQINAGPVQPIPLNPGVYEVK